MVPSSGIVTWKSESASSRNASNGSSVRSSSSISRTGGPSGLRLHRLEQRPADQEALGEELLGQRVPVGLALRLGGADRHHLRRKVPLVDRARRVEPLVALQPDQPPPERRPTAPWRSRSCRRRPRPRERAAARASAPGRRRSRARGRRRSPRRRAAPGRRRCWPEGCHAPFLPPAIWAGGAERASLGAVRQRPLKSGKPDSSHFPATFQPRFSQPFQHPDPQSPRLTPETASTPRPRG